MRSCITQALTLAALVGVVPLVAQEQPPQNRIEIRSDQVSSDPRGQRPQAPPRDNQPEKPATARIRGRVIGGENGSPLRRAVVMVMGEGLKGPKAATTDENGRYEVSELPAGRFQVRASKAGYVALAYGQRRPFSGGTPVELRDGQQLDGIDLNLPRGAVVTGRVTDEFGEPIASVGVQAMRYTYWQGRRNLSPVGMTSTDDLGRFRIFGLAAGEYYISAKGQSEGYGWMNVQGESAAFASTYYPGTVAVSEAQRVRVAAGNETSGINFAVVSARGARISGTALNSKGRPVQGFVMLIERNGPGGYTMSNGGPVDADDGSFQLAVVPPGEYTLQVQMGMGGDDQESGSAVVTVNGQDVTGVNIVTAPPAVVRGQVMFETQPGSDVRPTQFSLFAQARDPDALMFGTMAAVKDDWTFEARLPQPGMLLRASRFPDRYMLKAVMADGVDVTDSGLPVRPGEHLDGVQVLVSNRITRLSGSVQDDRGAVPSDATVLVFAVDENRWTTQSRWTGAAASDRQGKFELKGLPAGDYLAVALENVEDGRAADPEFLRQIKPYGLPVTLSDGEQKTVALRLSRVE